MSPYFGGEPSNLGRVSALPVSTFAELVEKVIGHGVPVPFSQADLLAMPEKDQNAAKKTKYIVPCTFRTSPSPRQTSAAVSAGTLCLDIDDSEQAGRMLKTGFEKSLGDLNCVVWHTARSTPEAPRLRVVVQCEPIVVSRYGFAVTALAGLLGMDSVNHESKVPVQPMYLPLAFKDAEFSPIIYSKTDGRAFDPSALEGLEELRGAPAANEPEMGDIEYLRAPLDDLSRDEIVDALSKIPADCSMQQWVEIGMALKHQFGEAGYPLWDDWSASAPDKYPSQEETAKRWASMKAQPKDRVPVTIRSVIRIATEAGWNNRPLTQRMFDAARDWIKNPARTPEDLLDEGAKRLAKLATVIGPIESKVLISDLHSTIRSRGLRGPTVQDIAKEVTRLASAASRASAGHPPWASNIVFLTASNMFYQTLDDRKIRREVMDLIRRSPVPDMSTSHYLIHDAGIPVCENLRYEPAEKKRLFTADGVPFINSYRPTYPKPDYSQKDEAGALVLMHIKNLFGLEWYKHGMNFAALPVKLPGKKCRWAVFIHSALGAGKGVYAYIIEIGVGKTNLRRVSPEHILAGTHNGWAVGSQVCVCDEIHTGHNNGQRMMDVLKPLISDDMIAVRELYEPVRTVPNITNWLFFSNFRDALRVHQDDRRYFCVPSPLQTRAQVAGLGSDYFKKLYSELFRLRGGVRAFLESWEFTDDFNPEGRAPQTDFLNEMARITASPLRRAVQEVLEDEPHSLVRRDLVSITALRGCISRDGVPPFSDQALANILREEGFVSAGRHIIDGSRHTLWTTGPVEAAPDQARLRFELL